MTDTENLEAPTPAPQTAAPTSSQKDYDKLYNAVIEREKHIAEKFHTPGAETVKLYQGDKAAETPFNILYSNTEIFVPNVYSNTPQPVVKRRFGESQGDNAARAAERMISYTLDTNVAGYADFDTVIESVVLDAALPGQGHVRIRLVDGVPVPDYVQFDRFVWAYARRWEDVPWIAYRHDKTHEDLKELAKSLQVDAGTIDRYTFPVKDDASREKGPDTVPVYEVWNKSRREVCFLCEACPGKHLQTIPDPFGLTNFYPSPSQPLRFIVTTCDTMPRNLYELYRRQAEELNAVSERIKRITQAIRVRGIYNGSLPELNRLFEDGSLENALIPAEQAAVMLQNGSLDNQIWLIPVEKLITTLQALFIIREQIKGTIYETLGIGDILRGQSKASETLGAQKIKDKWGTLRIRKSQARVASFIREVMRIIVELAAKKTPENIWAQVTSLPVPSQVEAMVLQQTGQAPPPEHWGTILNTLRNDLTRSYTIDIENNSTVDAEATEERQNLAEFMTAFGQAMSGLGPLAQAGPEGFEVAKLFLIDICTKYRLDPQIKTMIKQMKPPPQKMPPEVQKQVEDAKKRMDQHAQQLDQREQAVKQQEEALAAQEQAAKQARMDVEAKMKELNAAVQELTRLREEALREIEGATREARMQQQLDTQAAELKVQKLAAQLAEKTTALEGVQKDAESEQKVAGAQKEVVDSGSQQNAETLRMLSEMMQSISEALVKLGKPRIRKIVHDETTGRAVGMVEQLDD